jgi:hypothetical protein
MSLIPANGTAQIVVPSGESIAVYCVGTATVSRLVGYPNYPDQVTQIGVVDDGQTVFGSYSSGATIIVDASGGSDVYYEVGNAPVVKSDRRSASTYSLVNSFNTTGTISSALLLGGLITSTTAAAVSATLPSGAGMDLAAEFVVGETFDWSVVNTGPNTFTVLQGSSGHTVVGSMAVATLTSGLFRTRKTAVDTFVTYRLA